MNFRSVLGRCVVLVAVITTVLTAISSGAGALNPEPTLEMGCNNGASELTVVFPASTDPYGSFRLRDARYGAAGTVSVPGPIAGGTTMVIPVPDGWDPMNSTVHLGWPELFSGDDERHITPTGETCAGDPPPVPTPTVSVDCVAGALTVTFDASLNVTFWLISATEPTPAALLGLSFFGAPAGSSVTLPLRTGTTEVTVSVNYADGRQLRAVFGTACECTWTSVKDFSNVIVRYADGTELKFDDLDGTTFSVPNDPDNPIVAVWIKAGREKLDPNDPAPQHYGGNGIGVFHQVENCMLVP